MMSRNTTPQEADADATRHRASREPHDPPSLWRVFAEGGTAGNCACVHISAQPVPVAHRRELAAKQPGTTQCFTWLEDAMTQCHRVHCHSGQTEIQRCGHGFLAVAGSLLATGVTPPLNLLAADDTPIALTLVGDKTTAKTATASAQRATGPRWEIHLPRLRCNKTELPTWAHRAFEPAPTTAATAGDDNGYWVFEWGPDCDLAQLALDSAVITRHTRRAVIATQAASTDPGDYDFHLRYFAPQYGVIEDTVTGSANAVLADYWAERLGISRFRARQCSAGGGVVYSRLTATSVAISGEVARL